MERLGCKAGGEQGEEGDVCMGIYNCCSVNIPRR